MKETEKYFESAGKSLNIKRIFTIDEIDKLIEQSKAPDVQHNKTKSLLHRSRYLIMLTILASALLLYLNIGNNTEIITKTTDEPIARQITNTALEDSSGLIEQDNAVIANTDTIVQTVETQVKETTKEEESEENIHMDIRDIQGLIVLELSKDELAALNIKTTDTSLTYFSEDLYFKSVNKFWHKRWISILADKNYDTSFRKPLLERSKHDVVWKSLDNSSSGEILVILTDTPYVFDTQFNPDEYSLILQHGDDIMNYEGWNYTDYLKFNPIMFSFDEDNFISFAPNLFFGDSLLKSYYELMVSIWKSYEYFDDNPELDSGDVLGDLYFNNILKLDTMQYNICESHKLLPVRISVPFDSSITKKAQIDLWYIATEDFISALPERYSKPLRKEIKILDDLSKDLIPYEDACRGLTGQESFFDLCRRQSDAVINFSVYPNPASEHVNLNFEVLQKRKFNISLHDINGKFIRQIADYKLFSEGCHEYPVTLDDIQNGIYIIALTSDYGDQLIRRLIVNK